jgi:hypothetical protein
MMCFERPDAPEEFEARVREARRAVQVAVEAGQSPSFDESLWQRYKSHFAVAQHSKCAFCEMSIVSHDGAVDHFAPKAEVWELSANPEERGHEREDGLPNVRGRKASGKLNPGYWWLAYEWRNYLVVCSVCNTKWKGCYFPLEVGPRQGPPDRNVPEKPLLLNPFEDPAPWRHFRFDQFGQMAAPESLKGQATMEVLGFDAYSDGQPRRPTLRDHRAGPARDAHVFARKFVHHSLEGRQDRAEDALDNLCELGSIERDHAGMVRAIAEHVTKYTWDQLMRLRPAGRDA